MAEKDMKSIKAHSNPNSLKALTKYRYIKTLLLIQCICQLLNNAFRAVCDRNPIVKLIVTRIRLCPDQLIGHTTEVGTECLRMTSTRWISLFSIYDLIKIHPKSLPFLDQVEEFLQLYDITLIFFQCSKFWKTVK
jgi:hypothetical protein